MKIKFVLTANRNTCIPVPTEVLTQLHMLVQHSIDFNPNSRRDNFLMGQKDRVKSETKLLLSGHE